MVEELQFRGGQVYDSIEEINKIISVDDTIDIDDGREEISHLKELRASKGAYALRYNKDGFYIGAEKIDDAKFGYRYDDTTLFIRDGVFTMYNGTSKTVEIKGNNISIFNGGDIKIYDSAGNVSIWMKGG